MTNFDDLFAPPQGSPARSSSVPTDQVSDLIGAVSSSVDPVMPSPSSAPTWDSSSEASIESTDRASAAAYPSPRRGGIVDQIVAGVVEQLRPLLEPASTSPPDPNSEISELAPETQVNHLQAQLDLMQLRQEKLHRQVVNYEAEIDQLHKEKRLLEQTIAELPEIYQLKFQTRLEPIRHRIHQIQTENQHLRTEVYELSYQLHRQPQSGIRRWPLRLPQFPRRDPHPLTALPRPGENVDLTSRAEY